MNSAARNLEIYIPPGPRLGDVVIECKGVSKGYQDRLLIDKLDASLPPGGIIGVIGPNGAGKTTLLRMITSQEEPDEGSLRIGETVSLAYVDQSRADLDPEKTVWEEISAGQEFLQLGSRRMNSRAVRRKLQFPWFGSAEESGRALGRGTQSSPSRKNADFRCECSAIR